jgi:hypothetical protein
MATNTVFIDNLNYEVSRILHRLPPLPYEDSTGTFKKFRKDIIDKVSHIPYPISHRPYPVSHIPKIDIPIFNREIVDFAVL